MGKVVFGNEKSDIFGNLFTISNGIIELKVTVDFGPRIISASLVGKENMMYQDTDKKILGDKFDCYEGDQIILYGGHRIWVSPEDMPTCYYPDNKPVKMIQNGNSVTFVAPVEKANLIQKSMEIQMSQNSGDVTIVHKIQNLGNWDIELAPWCITMLAAGGLEIMPVPDKKTGYLHNKHFSFWDYSKMNDERLNFMEKYIALEQKVDLERPFKLGYNNEKGWAAYFNKGQVFVKKFESDPEGVYPDNGCSFETFTCSFMTEMETLGEMVLLEKGAIVEHTENWSIYESNVVPAVDEKEIDKIINKFVL